MIMGFRTGAYATIWEVTPEREFSTKLRISTSKKNKNTGEYEQDFSGYVSASGKGAAQKAAKLNVRDRIRLGDVDVTTTYNKESGKTYTNFKIFSFDTQDEIEDAAKHEQKAKAPDAKPAAPAPAPDPDDVPW